MPTELEELVEFLHHGNTQIRQSAVENLVPYSKTFPSIFKFEKSTPVKDLKVLIKDYPPIAKNALTILINISGDREILQNLAEDNEFLESLLSRITNVKEPNANEMAMLFANMAKSDSIERILTLSRPAPLGLSDSKLAIDQLLDCFVKGARGTWNPHADFNYLAYLFADLAKFRAGASHLTTPRPPDPLPPLSKLLPFTHTPYPLPRRLGTSTALKNILLHPSTHNTLLSPTLAVTLLPAVLLPLASGTDTYSESETDSLPEELQFLEPDKEREQDLGILKTWLEVLLLLCTSREGREKVRAVGGYAVVRECHLRVEDEGSREGCEKVVDILMRDEEGEEAPNEGRGKKGGRGAVREIDGGGDAGRMVTQRELDEDNRLEPKSEVQDEDEDDQVVEIF